MVGYVMTGQTRAPKRRDPARRADSKGANTKERILQESMRLFAIESYNGVSMRDIASEIGIKSSSIYNYYPSKEILLREILERFAAHYDRYFAWLRNVAGREQAPERLVDLMISKLLEIDDMQIYYGLMILLKEQFANQMVRDMAFQLFHVDSVAAIREQFDRLVAAGEIPPCDTQTIAAFFMYCLLVGATLRMHEALGHPTPTSSDKLYQNLKEYLIDALKSGV